VVTFYYYMHYSHLWWHLIMSSAVKKSSLWDTRFEVLTAEWQKCHS